MGTLSPPKTTLMKKTFYVLSLIVIVLGLVLFFLHPAKAGTPNSMARIATTSAIAVGPQVINTLFTTPTPVGGIQNMCAARIVSTQAQPIMLSFTSSMTPSGTLGFWQAASTTVSYPSDQYGCGQVTAYGYASSSVTVEEARW